MIEQTENVIVLADESKLARIAPFKIGSLGQIDYFICNTMPSSPWD